MKEIEELYFKETGDKATYRKDSSDYHTLKYVSWLESRFEKLEKKNKELKEGLNFIDKKDSLERIAELENENAELKKQVERLKTMSTVEMMCENANVDMHIREWEIRCLKAEKKVEDLKCCGNCKLDRTPDCPK